MLRRGQSLLRAEREEGELIDESCSKCLLIKSVAPPVRFRAGGAYSYL